MDRECMNAAGKFSGKCLVDHPVPLDSALSAEGLRHDMHSEMALAAGPMTSVPLVPVRFIDYVEALGRKCGGKLLGNLVPDLHEV